MEEQDWKRQRRDTEGNMEIGGMRLDSRAQKGAKAKGKDKESSKEEIEMGWWNLWPGMKGREVEKE